MPEQETQNASEDKDKFIAVSRPMLDVLRRLERAAKRDVSIFLYGQTGTGKSMLAKWIHQKSHRSNCPFVAVSCAAIPESLIESQLFGHERGSFTGANQKRIGLFERAQNGTLFLDEIGDASPDVQKKLLRALQERTIERIGGAGKPIPISARIISATNKNLPEEIKKDAFREDLYQRLKAVAFRIPPLRKRRKDLPLLIEAFAEKYAEGGKPVQFSQEALSILFMYEYPGNVRDLENAIMCASTFAADGVVRPEHLPEEMRQSGDSGSGETAPPQSADRSEEGDAQMSLTDAVERLERMMIEQALRATGGVQAQAAKRLRITERKLQTRIKKYKIEPSQYSSEE